VLAVTVATAATGAMAAGGEVSALVAPGFVRLRVLLVTPSGSGLEQTRLPPDGIQRRCAEQSAKSKGNAMNPIWIVLIVLVILALVGSPGIGFNHSYGWGPSGLVGVIVVVLLILLLMGRL